MPRLRILIALTAFVMQPLAAADSGSTGMANLMRGMITGLSLLGQASNPNPGLGYPGLGYPGLGYPGLFPGAMPGAGWFGTNPWNAPAWGTPGTPRPYGSPPAYPNSPYSQINAALLRRLQGSWETDTGGLLIVEGRLARLYLSRDRYQDIELGLDHHYLWIRPAGDAAAPAERYEHRIFDKRIILRNADGGVLLLRRFVGEADG